MSDIATKILPFAAIPLILNILDLTTTYIGITYLGLIETNPLFSELMIVFKLTFFTLVMPLSYFALKKQRSLLLPIIIFISIFIGVFSVIVAHNIIVIMEV